LREPGSRADVEVGYDRDRIRALSRHTRDAIAGTFEVRSSDPAAADALRAVRLLRQNLEDHWMPALLDIERSEAMVSWNRARQLVGDGRPPGSGPLAECGWTPLSGLRDDDLLGQVTWWDRQRPTGFDAPPTRFEERLDTLATELALRVARDAHFADRLVSLAATHPLIGSLTGRARFPAGFTSRVVTAMVRPGPVATADVDHYAEALSVALTALVSDPAACLDLLLDPVVLHGIASSSRLDPEAVYEFVLSGLHTSVLAEPGRLVDGYRVLAQLTALANGPLDGSIHPGLALGVAGSMVGYVDTLAPAIRQEGTYPVLVAGDGFEIELGTYDEVVDLFGVVLRDAEAQAALGIVLAGYVTAVVTRNGAAIVEGPGLQYVSRFADLIADATLTERAELVMDAAAEEARRRQIGGMIGFGLTMASALVGAESPARAVVSRAVTMATNAIAHVDPAEMPDARIPSTTYDLVTVVALGVVTADRSERSRAGLDAIDGTDWDEVARRLAEIDSEDDPDEHTRKILRLDHWIEAEVPPLAAYLVRIRSAPGMDELTEGRTAVRED
jgi:hypothetical protein